MPAYVQHHTNETAPVLCPNCMGLLPMYPRDVEPHWDVSTIDFIYECSDCGSEVRTTVTRPVQHDTSAGAGVTTPTRSEHSRQSLQAQPALV